MFQHDNARPHVARICTQFLEAENVPILPWAAYSQMYHPLSMCEMLWINVYDRQRVPGPTYWQFWSKPLPFLKVSVTNRCMSVFLVMWNPYECISIDWFPYMNCNLVKSLKFLHVAFLSFFSICVDSTTLNIDVYYINHNSEQINPIFLLPQLELSYVAMPNYRNWEHALP